MQTNQPNQNENMIGIGEQDLVDFVIYQRERNIRRDDIIAQLCVKANLTWQQAESLMQRVEREHPPHKPSWIQILNLPTVGFFAGIFVILLIYLVVTRQQLVATVFLPTSGREWRVTHVEAGQTIVLEYDIQVNSGSLFIGIDHSIIDKIVHAYERDPFKPWVWTVHIDSTGKGRATIPVPRGDYYEIYLSRSSFSGSYDITWTVHSPE